MKLAAVGKVVPFGGAKPGIWNRASDAVQFKASFATFWRRAKLDVGGRWRCDQERSSRLLAIRGRRLAYPEQTACILRGEALPHSWGAEVAL